jgi:hypothetical protein
LSDNRLVYGGFYPQDDLKDQAYGIRKAIAQSQLYEKDEGYIKTGMMEDIVDTTLESRRQRTYIHSHSPLDRQQQSNSKSNDDDSQIKSLTGTSSAEKRASSSSMKSNRETTTDQQN